MNTKLVFVNRYYDPDESATSQMLTDLARGLAARSVIVHVVCSRQLYTDAKAPLLPRESRVGVTIHRVCSTRFGRSGLFGRACDYLSFYLMSFVKLVSLVRRGDVLIAKTDPPLISIPAAIVARLKGARLLNWQQDVFPEVAARLAGRSLPRWVDGSLRRLRDASLRTATMNVVICGRMRDYLTRAGVPATKLCVIENWADSFVGPPRLAEQSELRARLGLTGRFVVGYSGNLGRAHDFDTVLGAAVELRADPSIVFLMIGGGVRMDALRAAVNEQHLGNFVFLEYQPRETLGDSLAAADVHWVSLLPSLEGLIFPSKLYGIMAAGRPLIFIGDEASDVASLVRETSCGLTVPVRASTVLANALRRLKEEPETCAAMGTRARALFAARFAREHALERWISVVNHAVCAGSDASSAAIG